MHTSPLLATVVTSAQGRSLNVLGHTATVQLARQHSAGHYYVFSLITPPGHGIPPHVHDREDEMIHVVEGTFLITLGGRQYRAGPGDQVFFPRLVAHAFQNIGSSAGRTVWTVVPGGNFEDFFEQLAGLPPGPPDPQRVGAIFAAFGMTLQAS